MINKKISQRKHLQNVHFRTTVPSSPNRQKIKNKTNYYLKNLRQTIIFLRTRYRNDILLMVCSNDSLFLSCQMGLSDGPFFMIKQTPLTNGNHPISSPICPMGVADTLGLKGFSSLIFLYFYVNTGCILSLMNIL